MRIVRNYNLLLLFGLILLPFKGWFFNALITGGDFWYSYPSNYNQYNIIWYAWSYVKGNGLGSNATLYQAINFVFGLPLFIFGYGLHFPFETISKFVFFYPFLILSIFSSYYLHKKILGSTKFWIVTSLIYTTNTYILTVVSGGQIIIGLSYALSPILLYFFISGISGKKNKISVFSTGALFGLLALLDLRYAYVLLVGVFLYFIIYTGSDFRLKHIKNYAKTFFSNFLSPIILGLLLNGFWSVPLILNRKNPISELGETYSSVGSVKFLSFATFENSIALLHPNWPENLFGKVYFMRPEFLVIPILAFISIFFVNRVKDLEEKRNVIFFILLGLLGAFLSKGSQEPFGNLYLFLFSHVPGMEMFRDPTKFYTLTAISYSILIPYVFYKVLYKRLKFLTVSFLLVCFFCFWLFLIRQAVFQEIGGTFKSHTIPNEYIELEKTLKEDRAYSRVLWMPKIQRFGYYSDTHPPISANDFLKRYTYNDLYKIIHTESTQNLLSESSVGYIIVPYDSMGEIFLEDRKYSQKLNKKMVEEMEKISYLKRNTKFKDLGVFETAAHKNHFWVNSKGTIISFTQMSPVEFNLDLKNVKENELLVFSENFDPGWRGKIGSKEISSSKYHGRLNSFILPSGNYQMKIYYKPQIFVNIGVSVSIITVIFLMIMRFRKSFKLKKKK